MFHIARSFPRVRHHLAPRADRTDPRFPDVLIECRMAIMTERLNRAFHLPGRQKKAMP